MLRPDQVFSRDVLASLKEAMPLPEVEPSTPVMNELMSFIQDEERPMRRELERMSTSIVYNNFPIFLNNKPHVKVKAKVVDYILPPDSEGGKAPEPRPELMDEYRKRKLINMITQGAGISTHGIHHLNDAFKQRNTPLIEAYDAFDKQNRALMRLMEDQQAIGVSEGKMETVRILGMVKVEYAHGRWVIDAEAILMPVLIHEVVKGMYELIAMEGLPEDERIRESVLEYTDTKSNELIDLKYGEVIYPAIRDAIRGSFSDITDERPEAQEYYLQELYRRPPLEMLEEVERMITGRMDIKKARSIMNGIYKDMKQDDYEASIR